MKFKGAFVGLVTVDLQYQLDSFPERDKKVRARHVGLCTGGPATNASVTFSHLGGEATLITVIGENPFASFILEELQSFDVNPVDLSPTTTDLPIVSAIITTEANAERTIINSLPRPIVFDRGDFKGFSQQSFDVLLVDGWHMPACQTAAELAIEEGIPVVFDADTWKRGTDLLLSTVNIVICSEQFQPPDMKKGSSILDYFASRGIQYRAVTRGEKSILYSTPERTGEILVETTNIVDTQGAGDVFHGAFCYFFAQSDGDFVYGLTEASKIATKSCQNLGARGWMQRS
jgi:sugar/nucleoside kinase (ribokinase family)